MAGAGITLALLLFNIAFGLAAAAISLAVTSIASIWRKAFKH